MNLAGNRSARLSSFFALMVVIARIANAQNLGFVVDNSQNSIRVIDLAQRSVSATIPVGQHPAEMLILPNNQTAYVTDSDDNNVAVIDLQNQALITTIPTGQQPGSLIASPDGRFVYIAGEGSNDVTFVDTAARAAVATIPVDATPVMVNLSPNGRFLYAVNQDADPTGTVTIIDTNRRQVIGSLAVGLRPVQFAVSPGQHTAYVVNTGSNSLSIVDLDANQVTGQISVGSLPSSVTFSNDGRFIYSVNRGSNNISVVDASQNRVIANIPVGSQPVDMVVTFDGHYGYVSNQGSNTVTLLDLTTRTAELTIPTGIAPFDLTLDSNEDFLYATNLGSQSVTVIDVSVDRAVATVPLGGVPVQFTQYNAPTLLELAPNPAPAGSTLTLNGEGLLPSATVQFVTSAPPRTVTVQPAWLDGEGLQVTVPTMQGASAVVSVNHPDGNSSEQLTLRFGTSSSVISSGGVVEGAGFQAAPYPISGGSIASVFGTFPGVTQGQAGSFPLPTNLGNAQVTFNGALAPLLFSSSGQINLVTPVNLFARSSIRVAVTAANQTSRIETVNVAPAAPGTFQISATSLGAFVHGTRPKDLVTTADPAQRGETLTLFVTGLGDTFPEAFDGQAAPGDVQSSTPALALVSINGISAHVSFSGLAPGFAGLYQINVDVPPSTPVGDQIPVFVSMGGRTSNTVRLVVR